MQKDFDIWNEKKKELERRNDQFLFKEGDIWWCSIGVNIKDESCGKGYDYQRPVLILKKLSSYLFIGIPLSTQKKQGTWFEQIFIYKGERTALLYQIRMFHTNRFQHRLAILDQHEFSRIKEKTKQLLGLF